jgi:hypothetical protein
MFRPEMLRPMGLPEDVSVIAWGLSLERRACAHRLCMVPMDVTNCSMRQVHLPCASQADNDSVRHQQHPGSVWTQSRPVHGQAEPDMPAWLVILSSVEGTLTRSARHPPPSLFVPPHNPADVRFPIQTSRRLAGKSLKGCQRQLSCSTEVFASVAGRVSEVPAEPS